MSSLLARLASTMAGRWKPSLLAALAVIALLGVGSLVGAQPADDFEVPGAESQRATELFRQHMPALAGADSTLVFTAADGRVSDPAPRRAITGALAKVRDLADVTEVGDPFAPDAQTSRDGRLVAVEVRYDVEQSDLDKEDGVALIDAARSAERGGAVRVAMRGAVVDVGVESEAPVGEIVGVGIAVLLLTLLFRSPAAMGATLLGALGGVIVGQLLLASVSQPLGLPAFAATIALMLGLGAGIDYALLVVARFREQLAAGDSVRDAAGTAAATAGTSVVTAGLVVMVAIAGLLVVGIPFIGNMGIGAAIGVAAVVLATLTILPAILGATARRLRPKDAAHTQASPAFARWAQIVTRRPRLSIGAGLLVLLVFAFPVTSMRLGQPDDGNKPKTSTQRVAYDQQARAFGAGSNGPFLIAVDLPAGASDEDLAGLQQALTDTPGIVSVSPAARSDDGQMATIAAVPRTSPQDARTSELLERLRERVIPDALRGTPLKAYVGGGTAIFEDLSDKVAARLPLFVAVVIGLSVVLLMAAFRSLWVPLTSAALNLLSIAAAYGVVVAVFQQGTGAELVGVGEGVPIVSVIPVMLFAILFGLSMDYNVFLLSRIREAYHRGDPPRQSVVNGVARIGKIVFFAGLIMTSVFLAFVSQPDVIAKMLGLGLGVAILVDVIIVRLIITPAIVTLLGDRAWWLPGWIDRLMPSISLEGHPGAPAGLHSGRPEPLDRVRLDR